MQVQEITGRVRAKLALRTRVSDAREALTQQRYAQWRKAPVQERTVLYEAFSGNGVLDNPEAIFRYLLAQPDMQDLEHVWALDSIDDHPDVVAEFESHPKVRFVETLSPGYLKALATSKYLVNNATFPPEFAKRPGQVYVNTWHGAPLKHMGYDLPDGGQVARNILRNFLAADFLISANPHMTDRMYRDGYRLQGIYRGAVIEEGQPRTDRQFEAARDRSAAIRLLEDHGVRIDGRRVVLYAPTWRGESFQSPRVNSKQLLSVVEELQAGIDSEQYVVLLKVHQIMYDAVLAQIGKCDFLVPNDVPTNTILGISDVLITDYSSICFDFLALDRPLLHYVPDLEEYRDGRGLYLSQEQLFGPVSSSVQELLADLKPITTDRREHQRNPGHDAARQTFAAKEDGRVAEKIVDIVFRGASEADYTVRRDFGTDKETLLIYLGTLTSMGITTSGLNLLRNIDYDRYDVTAFYHHSKRREQARNAEAIDPRARVLPRIGSYNGGRGSVERQKKLFDRGLGDELPADHIEFWTDEWRRLFGMSVFDHLIDFSGYGNFCPFLFSVTPARQKSIWLHNDLKSDSQRETIGNKHLEQRLQAVFTTYRHFDNLVSVSPELNEVNRRNLAEYAGSARFTFALNTIDGHRVLRRAGVTRGRVELDHHHVRASEMETPRRAATFDTENLASAVNSLLSHFDVREVLFEVRGRARLQTTMQRRRTATTFVSVGRLSPEKNHERMIRAFARVQEENPNIALVILGGGQLMDRLQSLIVSLGMEQYVTLAGQVDNPYSIMAESDCFVLSSDYEGQPMVILEARTLGLPVITTAFSSVGDSVPADAGVVVPKSVKGVADGMRRFLEGKVPASALDIDEYNQQAMEQFYSAIGSPLSEQEVNDPA